MSFDDPQAGRQLALRTAAKLAQKAEYIWMDGKEGHEMKVSSGREPKHMALGVY